MTRIGFVGAGAIARRHFDVLRGRDDASIAAVCDADPARAHAAGAQTGATAHTDWEEMLRRERLDAVFVCTPPGMHAPPAVAALERGVPVYLEKPLARSLRDGRAIVGAWRRSGTVCAVGYQWRSLEILDRLREVLAGAPPGMLISRSVGPTEPGRGDAVRAGGSWFADPARSGGILFELGSHDIDLQLAVAGRATAVQAVSGSGLLALADAAATGLDDAVAVQLRFASGGVGAIVVAWTDVEEPPLYTLDVVAAQASLHVVLDPEFRIQGRAGGSDVDVANAADPRVAAVERFLAAAATGTPASVPCSPDDAFHTLEVALAAETAIASGSPVTLPPE